MSEVKLSKQQLDNVTSQLTTCADNLKAMCDSLRNECDELKSVFKGKCADAYNSAFNDISENVLYKMQGLLYSYPETIAEAERTMFANDQQLADNIRGRYSALYE